MNTLTIKQGKTLIAHLEDSYKAWYKSLTPSQKEGSNNWNGFVKKSVEVNNDNDGSEEDFIFIAEDSINHLINDSN